LTEVVNMLFFKDFKEVRTQEDTEMSTEILFYHNESVTIDVIQNWYILLFRRSMMSKEKGN